MVAQKNTMIQTCMAFRVELPHAHPASVEVPGGRIDRRLRGVHPYLGLGVS